MQPKFIFVVGGVMSGVGKGAATSSIAAILKSYGFKVTAMKIDPYLNSDAGTFNPIEHGEVFVTKDGLETDQDIGNYERFLGESLTRANYATGGQIYAAVIRNERELKYGGKTVETIPHVRDEIIERIMGARDAADAEFTVVEIGGTVGEDQNSVFFHAIRRMRREHVGRVLIVLVSHVPRAHKGAEMKTKPTQQAHSLLNSKGLHADIILARADTPIDEPRRRKIADSCDIDADDVISAPDVRSIYEIPINFEREGFGRKLLSKLGLEPRDADLAGWERVVSRINAAAPPAKIAVIGKYFRTGEGVLTDSYLSVIEAIKHAAWENHATPDIHWLDAEDFEHDASALDGLAEYGGIIVPGGFGGRGVEGKIAAIHYARENSIPYFGLCYGMQLAVIEYARNVLGLGGANTTEVDERTPHPVVDFMSDQRAKVLSGNYGASMRLGAYACDVADGTLARRVYGAAEISERHRHRYEVNNEYRERLAAGGLVISGQSPDGNYVEMIEVPGHPFFLGTQFHPELQSSPLAPHPLFTAFVAAALARHEVKTDVQEKELAEEKEFAAA